MYHLLDCGPHVMCPDMAQESDQEARAARCPGAKWLAMPWLQFNHDRRALNIPLLVSQGGEPEIDSWTTTPFLWPDVLQAKINLPSSLWIYDLPRRALPTV